MVNNNAAQGYKHYLETTYETNRTNNLEAWHIHENAMSGSLLRALHEMPKSHANTSLMVIGPGLHPTREIQGSTLNVVRQLNGVLIADTSLPVAQTAMQNLIVAGKVRPEILNVRELDVTEGRANQYVVKMSDELQKVESLEELLKALQNIQDFDFLASFKANGHSKTGWEWGKEEEVDIVNYSMVLAGVGAAAESVAWTRLYGLIAENVQERGEQILQEQSFVDLCSAIRETLHHIITKFHTASAVFTVRERVMDALENNKKPPVQISVQDVGTVLHLQKGSPSIFTHPFLPRIDRQQVQELLSTGTASCPPLLLQHEPMPQWNDEQFSSTRPNYIPGHGHPVERWKITSKEK